MCAYGGEIAILSKTCLKVHGSTWEVHGGGTGHKGVGISEVLPLESLRNVPDITIEVGASEGGSARRRSKAANVFVCLRSHIGRTVALDWTSGA